MKRGEKLFHGLGFLAWVVSLCELFTWQVIFPVRMAVNIFVLIFGIFVMCGTYMSSKDGKKNDKSL